MAGRLDLVRPFPRMAPLGILLATAAYLAAVQAVAGPRHVALALVGLALGIVLRHADFGFTSAWRRLLVHGDGRGLRAQLAMLAVGTVLFVPAIAASALEPIPLYGAYAPVGVSVAVGAFLFGIGMQLANGCASGCLFALGGGSPRMAVVLVFFVAGSLLGAAHAPWWWGLPSLGIVTLPGLEEAPWRAVTIQLTLLAALALASLAVERRRGTAGPGSDPRGWRLLAGPWPLLAGAVALALLNYATLLLAGRPWGITGAFALWGAKIAETAGVAVRDWPYWRGAEAALDLPVLADVTSVMNIAIVLGAALAAALAGRLRFGGRLAPRELVAAVVGGLLLGYGARLAFGCNIGAFFSGVVSGSLHGWAWLAAALAGNAVGVRLRPLFGLARD